MNEVQENPQQSCGEISGKTSQSYYNYLLKILLPKMIKDYKKGVQLLIFTNNFPHFHEFSDFIFWS